MTAPARSNSTLQHTVGKALLQTGHATGAAASPVDLDADAYVSING
jgi:hypothetical protein